MQLHIIGAADRYDAEEHQHQHVAQSLIREERGIEEGKDHTECSDEDHLQAAEIGQWQSDDTGHAGGQGYGLLHRVKRHPPLGTSPAGT